MKADKAHKIVLQTAVFLWIHLRIYSVDKERMDDDFKPASMITNLHKLLPASGETYIATHIPMSQTKDNFKKPGMHQLQASNHLV